MPPAEVKARFDTETDPDRAVRLWDATYARRARDCGWFLVCKADFMEPWRPPILRRADLLGIFGRVPGTQNPPQITSDEFHALTTFANESPNHLLQQTGHATDAESSPDVEPA